MNNKDKWFALFDFIIGMSLQPILRFQVHAKILKMWQYLFFYSIVDVVGTEDVILGGLMKEA